MKQGTFFAEDQVRNSRNDEEWTSAEDDQLLDLYFSGTIPDRCAVKLKRNPKSIARRLEQFTYNERGLADDYRARRRINRQNMRLTENERLMIKAHQDRGVKSSTTARILMRKPEEFSHDYEGTKTNNRLKQVATEVDIILAHRYLAYCCKQPVISKQSYDLLVKEEIEFGGGADILARFPASSKNVDYPPHIRSLAYYMLFKFWQSRGESSDMEQRLPYGDVQEFKKDHRKYNQ